MVRWAAVLIGASVFVAASAAADASRIALSVPGRPALEARLAAELRALGFIPIEADREPRDGAETRVIAERTGAGAAIWIPREGGSIQIWIADRITGKTVMRVLDTTEDAVVALAATELLRASLLEVTLLSSAGVEPPTEPMTQLALGPLPSAAFAIRAGVLGHIDGPSASVSFGASLDFVVLPWLELGVRVDIAPFATVVDGSTEAAITIGRAGGRALVGTDPRDAWQVFGGIELDLAVGVADGRPGPGLSTRADWALALGLGVTGGLRIRSEVVFVELGGSVGVLVPPIEVAFFNRPVGRLGQPLLETHVSLAFPF